MFLVTYVNGMRRAKSAKKDMFIALTSMGVGPGVNIESHNELAIEAIVRKSVPPMDKF
jgi:hypothetical protein